MKKLYCSVIFILVLQFGLTAQQKYTDSTFFFDGSISSFGVQNEIDSMWVVYKYHQNGRLMFSEQFKKNGYNKINQTIAFNPDGKVAYILPYRNDSLTGTFIEYFADGKLKIIGQYYRDCMIGEWSTYYDNGSLESRGTYTLSKDDLIKNEDYKKRLKLITLEFALEPMTFKMKNRLITDTLPAKHSFLRIETKKSGEWTYWDRFGKVVRREYYDSEGNVRNDKK